LELLLARDPHSARIARDAVAEELDRSGWSTGSIDAARVCVSELVSNALLHGEGQPLVSVDAHDGAVLVEVHDDGPATDLVYSAVHNGFGVRLVDELADSWGVRSSRGEGKTMWFELIDVVADDV
jgi:anti-sigma regulatory factor (Ser/Thr protein kinase)